MNLAQLSDDDLLALKGGDLSKVSDAGLLALKGGKAPEARVPTDSAVAVNAGNKGVAGIPDFILNTPNKVINLGKAAFGSGAIALGRPDLAPEPSEDPNYAHKALKAMGFIKDEAEPANAKQRVIDAMAQGGVGMAANPVKSSGEMVRNVIMGLTGGGAGGGTKEVTGSDALAISASMLTPAALNKSASMARDKSAELAKAQSANAVRDATLAAGRDAGYVVPPSHVNDSGVKGFINKRLESLGGKAAIKQEAGARNQTATNDLAATELGFPPGTAITPAKLKAFIDVEAAPYREVAALSPVAAQALERLKETRSNMNLYRASVQKTGDVGAAKELKKLEVQADMLEVAIEKVAARANKPDLVGELREARTKIAKAHDIERSLNLGDADVSASTLGSALDNGKKLTGNLETIAKVQQTFPQFTTDGAKIPTAGVSKSEALVAAAMAAGGMATLGPGGAALGALPLASGPARSLALSKPYQKLMATPDYSPSAITKMLAQMPPGTSKEQALQALMLGRAVAERNQQ